MCVCVCNGFEWEMTIVKKYIGVYNQGALPNLDSQAIQTWDLKNIRVNCGERKQRDHRKHDGQKFSDGKYMGHWVIWNKNEVVTRVQIFIAGNQLAVLALLLRYSIFIRAVTVLFVF